MSSSKRCNKCGETKPLDAFAGNPKNPDRKQYTCRQCIAEYDRAHRRPHKKKPRKERERSSARPAICIYDPELMYHGRKLVRSHFVASLYDGNIPDESRWKVPPVWHGEYAVWVVSGNKLMEIDGCRVLIAAGNENHPVLKEMS